MVMPRTRPYTRKELESLRRADLQNLFKIHGLKGANQKSDALIDSLEEFFISPTYKAIPPGSPSKVQRTVHLPIAPNATTISARQLKPIPSQGMPRVVANRPVTRKSPVKVAPVIQDRPVQVVGAEVATAKGKPARSKRETQAHGQERVPTARTAPSNPSAPSDALIRRVSLLSDRVQEIESSLTISPIAALSEDIASLRSEVSRLDAEIATLRPHAGSSGPGVADHAWERRIQDVEEGWARRFGAAEELWAERFRALERRMTLDGGAVEDDQSVGGMSATALGKRREREEPSETIGFPSEGSSSPSKRPRLEEAESPSSRDHLRALARRSASPSKSPRTPSPTKSSSHGVFKTPELPASLMKQLQSQPIAIPKTPSPGHQGLLPDNSATPAFASDSNYFAGLPPASAEAGGRSRSAEITLPFPLFATTPRPAAPTSPTTDAPPSSARRARATSNAQPGGQMMTPGRRPTRTVSHAHMELSTVTEDQSFALDTAPSALATSTTTQKINLPPLPSDNPHHSPLLGPELAMEVDHPPRLSPSPSITESRFSTIPFPFKPRTASSALGQTVSTPADLTSPSLPSNRAHSAVPGRLSGGSGPNTTPPPSAGTVGLGMLTPGHRTMLGTESYRDTRFGDLPVMMGWGTPEMPDTPRPGGSRGGGLGSGS